jgi:Xaa-Pro aminopeptidase
VVIERSALPPIDHADRVRRLVASAGEAAFDALLVTDLTDVRWLTGFGGSNAWAVVRSDCVTLGTDGRYGDRARAETAGTGVEVIAEQQASKLHQRLVESLSGVERVGLDARTTTHAHWTRLAADLPVEPVESPIRNRRQVKDDAEVARIAAAAAATDAALADVEPMLLASIDEPLTEAEVRTELEYRMRLHGADDRSYDTIVASGPEHAARPHHAAADRTIIEGDTVIVDVGALVDGYHSDMTRSWVIGAATDEQRQVYDLVTAAQRAGLDAVRGEMAARDLDSACRRVFADAGYGDWYLHGTGHGVGLDIHESPFHSQASDETIPVGSVVTVEPGLYRDGFGGFRIEDLVVVTETGHRVLTHSPKRTLD